MFKIDLESEGYSCQYFESDPTKVAHSLEQAKIKIKDMLEDLEE